MSGTKDPKRGWLETVSGVIRLWVDAVRFTTQGLAWVWLFAVVVLSGCLGGIYGARQTIANAAEIQTKAFKVLGQYDEEHQKRIVDDAIASGKLEDGAKALTEYRKKRSAALQTLKYAAHATLMADSVLPLVERGLAKRSELDGWIAELLLAGSRLYASFKDLGIKP